MSVLKNLPENIRNAVEAIYDNLDIDGDESIKADLALLTYFQSSALNDSIGQISIQDIDKNLGLKLNLDEALDELQSLAIEKHFNTDDRFLEFISALGKYVGHSSRMVKSEKTRETVRDIIKEKETLLKSQRDFQNKSKATLSQKDIDAFLRQFTNALRSHISDVEVIRNILAECGVSIEISTPKLLN